jgi:hypothetical protein
MMGAKELLPTLPADQSCDKTPYNEDSWQISMDGETKTFTWSDKNYEVTNDAKQLLELRTFPISVIFFCVLKSLENKPLNNKTINPTGNGGHGQ